MLFAAANPPLGYNIIHIVPNAGLANEAFEWDVLNKFLDVMDQMELWLMFDMSKYQHPIRFLMTRLD